MRHFLSPYRRLLNNDGSIMACSGRGRLMARDLPNPLSALAEIRRWTFAPAPMQATLRQAMDIMHTNTAEAACIYERSPNTGKQILRGICTRETIEKFSLASMV